MLSQIVTTDVIYVDLDNGEMSWQEHSAPIPDIYILPNTSQVNPPTLFTFNGPGFVTCT